MMKLPLRPLVSILVLAVVLAAGAAQAQRQQGQAPAQQRAPAPPAPSVPVPLPAKGSLIVVIDPQVIERDATAFQGLRTQHDRMMNGQQAEITKMEKDLRTTDEELNKQRTILSPEAYTQKRRDLDKRFADAQQRVQNGRRDIEQATGDAYNKVIRQMYDVVAEIVAEQDYKVVMARTQLVASQNSLDISHEVVLRLNKKMPTVAVAQPK
jgi:Skp family chaperone for outer membrane proteins